MAGLAPRGGDRPDERRSARTNARGEDAHRRASDLAAGRAYESESLSASTPVAN
jgi:hypothetical protein